MLKLNASYSKKVPAEGEYSSQSYHASIEVELSDGLTADQIQDRIHETFEMVRDSVEAELHGNGTAEHEVSAPRNQQNQGRQGYRSGTNLQVSVLTRNDTGSGTNKNQQIKFEVPPSFFPLIPTTEQYQAMYHVGNLVGLVCYDQGQDMEQIKCRILELTDSIFLNRIPRHPFSSESLARFASYLTIQRVGFIGQSTLEREAKFIIPKEPLLGISLEEFMPYFRTLFVNQSKLNFAEALTLGLFFLLFHYIISCGQYVFLDWTGLVPTIINQTYPIM